MQLPFHKEATPKIFEQARFLKKVMTPAEKILWDYLRNNRFKGAKFRRQHPVGFYIADFYCHKSKLIIEVDGEIHLKEEARLYDEKRTADLNEMGIKVMRFKNDEVLNQIKGVLEKIGEVLT
jgi:very-short-patch-repair endonuclease